MPIRRDKKICTIFERTAREKQADATVKELAAAKKELAETKNSLSELSQEMTEIRRLLGKSGEDIES